MEDTHTYTQLPTPGSSPWIQLCLKSPDLCGSIKQSIHSSLLGLDFLTLATRTISADCEGELSPDSDPSLLPGMCWLRHPALIPLCALSPGVFSLLTHWALPFGLDTDPAPGSAQISKGVAEVQAAPSRNTGAGGSSVWPRAWHTEGAREASDSLYQRPRDGQVTG